MALLKVLEWSIVGTNYKNKEHSAAIQTYKRRDADQTEGGSVHRHDSLQIDQVLQMDGPGQFRTIVETNGVTTISARSTLEDTIVLDEEVVLARGDQQDDTAVMAEEFSGVSGFGSGDFGDGGFGGLLT